MLFRSGWIWIRHGDAHTSTLNKYRPRLLRNIDVDRTPVNMRAVSRAIEGSGQMSGDYREHKRLQQQKAQQQQAQMEQEAQARMAETQAKNEKDMNVASTYADATKEAEAMKQEGQTARDLINNQHERRMNNG